MATVRCCLKDIVSKPVQTGHTPSMEVLSYYGGEIAFIKTDNLHDNQISMSFSDYLTETGNEKIKSTSLAEKDIITTIIGATEKIIARSAMIFSEHLPANINQNIVQIRVDDKKMYPEYVNIYLNCLYGKNYLLYLSRQTEQVNLNCKEVEIVPVPIFSTEFQSKIADIVNKARSFQYESESEYQRAEKLLITKLGFDGFIEPCEVCTVTNITSSFLQSGRLDAEYYQNKYEKYKSLLNTTDTVSSLCNLYDKNYIPDINDFYNYIELSDVGRFGEISDVGLSEGCDLPTRARRRVKKGQVIVSSIEGSLSSCALITSEYDGAICSNGFYVVDSDVINSETLLVLFKSKPIQALLNRNLNA